MWSHHISCIWSAAALCMVLMSLPCVKTSLATGFIRFDMFLAWFQGFAHCFYLRFWLISSEITAHLRLLHDCFMSKLQPAPMSAHVIAPDRTRTPKAHVWERGRGEGHGSVYLASQGAPARACGLGLVRLHPSHSEGFLFSSRRDPAAGERSGA